MIFIPKKASTGNEVKGDKVSSGRLRLQTDLTEYNEDKIKGINITFPNHNNIMDMTITVEPPKETLYAGAAYTFTLSFPPSYPVDPPALLLKDKVLHPQFDYQGKVCLPLLR